MIDIPRIDGRIEAAQQRRLVSEQAFLWAARSVIAAKGYADSTTEEIALAADRSPRTLFNIFESKSDLGAQLLDDLYSPQNTDIERAAATLGDLNASYPGILGALIEERQRGCVYPDIIPVTFGDFSSIIQGGQRSGQFSTGIDAESGATFVLDSLAMGSNESAAEFESRSVFIIGALAIKNG